MKVVSINGSPKGRNSNTNTMITALLKGLESNETEIINIFLSEKNIEYCTGCYTCWFKTPGICKIDDDMKELTGLMRNSDIIILGSPLYFNNISGTLKVFIDRLTATGGNPHDKAGNQDAARTQHFIMVSNCGFPNRSQFEVISLWIKNIARMMQSRLIGEFYTTNGNVLTQPEGKQEISRTGYLSFLTDCGHSYLNKLELNEEQKKLINKNILEF